MMSPIKNMPSAAKDPNSKRDEKIQDLGSTARAAGKPPLKQTPSKKLDHDSKPAYVQSVTLQQQESVADFDDYEKVSQGQEMSEHSEDDESPGEFKNNVRVIVRIRPLLQGEGGIKRITGTSG